MFDVVSVMLLVFWIVLNMQLINCFWKIQVVLKRNFKCFTAVVLKRANCRQVQWFKKKLESPDMLC